MSKIQRHDEAVLWGVAKTPMKAQPGTQHKNQCSFMLTYVAKIHEFKIPYPYSEFGTLDVEKKTEFEKTRQNAYSYFLERIRRTNRAP